MSDTVDYIKINQLLKNIGVRADLKGKPYLVVAIKRIMNDRSEKLQALYAIIAKQFDCTPSSVERAIRHAIEVTFSTVNPETLFDYFGNTFDPNLGKVTNKNFIYTCADIIKEDNDEYRTV